MGLRQLIGCILLSVWLTSPVLAQVIGEIQVEGASLSDKADVLKAIRTPVGSSLKSPATQRSISEDLKHISDLQKYDPLSIRAEARGTETLQTLVFIVKEFPTVLDILYSGNTKYKKKRLDEELEFEPGQPLFYKEELLDTLEEKLEAFYNSKGFSNVLVEGRVAEDKGTGVILEFAIEEGRKLKLQTVGFEGNNHFTDDELREKIKTTPKSFLVIRKKFDEEQFERDMRALEFYYQQNGFLETKVSEGTRKLVKNDKRMEVNFQVEEGPQYRLGKVEIDGATTFSRSDLLYPISVQRGEFLDRPRLIQNLQEVRSLYWNQGYRLVDIEPEIIPNRETGIADLYLRIQEGPRMRLRSIRFQGVGEAADGTVFDVPMETKDYVIEREFDIEQGDVLDWSEVEEAERRLVNLQFFEREEGGFPPKLKHGFQLEPIPGTREADVLVQLEETNTGFIQLGGGFSTDYGASLNFEFKDRNAFGRAWNYSLAADVGSKRQSVNLTFLNPHINNSDFYNRYRLFYRKTDRIGAREFGETRIGGAVAVGRQLTREVNAELEYRLENVKIEDTEEALILRDPEDDNASIVDLLFAEDSSVTSSMAFRMGKDTRDYVFFPTAGVNDQISLEGAGLGGDNKFLALSGTADRYLKLRDKMVLALRGHYAMSAPFGDTERIPLHERYFLGGSNTVRGFRSGGISPIENVQRRATDIDGNEIFQDDDLRVGGEAEWFTNLELRYRWNDTVQSVVFMDAGNVFEEATDFDLATTRASIGSGLRLNVFANALIRLDLGFPIAKEDKDDTQAFQFNFGASF